MKTTIFFVALVCTFVHTLPFRFSLMIDPAGDAQHTGRMLEDNFERGITLQCAETIKRELESRFPTLRVVLTRFPGETISPLQNANFANRLNVDLYVSIHFYQEQSVKPKLFLYCFSYGQEFVQSIPRMSFCPFDRAYIFNHVTTRSWAKKIKSSLEDGTHKKEFDVQGVFFVPFKPHMAIKAPAIAIEAGLKLKDDWEKYAHAIADSLVEIIEERMRKEE